MAVDGLDDLLNEVLADSLYDDVERALGVFERIRAIATPDDVPALIATMNSRSATFWVREMLSDPIAELGGLARLPELLAAYVANLAEGWDNDGFSVHLVDLVQSEPSTAVSQLERLREPFPDQVEWLLEFCEY